MCYLFLKDIVTLILTIAGIIIAGMGLSTWRKQIKGKKEFNAFYNLNYSLLKLRDAIKHVRNPAIWNAESDKAIQHFKKKYPEKKEDIEKNSNAYVYELRWKKITAAYTEMESHLLAVEVLWGNEILEKIKPLKKKIIDLNIALKQYLEPEFRTKKYVEIHDIIYNQSNDDKEDAFSQEVNNAIKEITDYLKQKTNTKT